MTPQQLKDLIQSVVKTNGAGQITGANLQDVLLKIVDNIGGGAEIPIYQHGEYTGDAKKNISEDEFLSVSDAVFATIEYNGRSYFLSRIDGGQMASMVPEEYAGYALSRVFGYTTWIPAEGTPDGYFLFVLRNLDSPTEPFIIQELEV